MFMTPIVIIVYCSREKNDRHNQDIETGRRPPPAVATAVMQGQTGRRHPPAVATAVLQVVVEQPPDQQHEAVSKRVLPAETVKEQIYEKNKCINDDCAICLEEFKDKETVQVVVTCQHLFHKQCIEMWLSVHRNCPRCRKFI